MNKDKLEEIETPEFENFQELCDITVEAEALRNGYERILKNLKKINLEYSDDFSSSEDLLLKAQSKLYDDDLCDITDHLEKQYREQLKLINDFVNRLNSMIDDYEIEPSDRIMHGVFSKVELGII